METRLRESQAGRAHSERADTAKAESQVVVHPVLVALFPVFFLYAPNQAQFGIDVTWKPALISVLVTTSLWLGLRMVLGDFKRAALWTTLAWLLFFSFDSFWALYWHLQLGKALSEIGLDHQIKLGAIAITTGAFVVAYQIRKDLGQATYLFNVIVLILVCMSLIDVVGNKLFQPNIDIEAPAPPSITARASSSAIIDDRPDIYYLILDGYGPC